MCGLSSFTSWNIWAIDDLWYPQSQMSKVQHRPLSSRALPGQHQGLTYWTPLRDLSSLCSSTLSPTACWTWCSRASRGPEVRGSELDITPSLITQGHHILVSNHGQEDNSERGKGLSINVTTDCVSLLLPEARPSIHTAIIPPSACSFSAFINPHSSFHFSFLVDFSSSLFAWLSVFFTTVVSPSPLLHSLVSP